MPATVHRISSYVKTSLQLKKRDLPPTSERASQTTDRPTNESKATMASSQSARQRQQQATQSALERMAVAYGLPVEAAAPLQPAYTPNYQNPDAVTAALEGILR